MAKAIRSTPKVLKDLKLTTVDLAAAAELSPSYVSRVISGQATPSVRSCLKLANAMGMSVAKFIQLIKSIQEQRYLDSRAKGAGGAEANGNRRTSTE